MVDPDYFTRAEVINNPIFRLIDKCPRGESIKKYYLETGRLVKTVRSNLTRLVIGNEGEKALERVQRVDGCRKLKEFKVPRAQFIYLSQQIARLFVNENPFTYYTPFRYIDKEKISASGTLVRHYEYLTKKFRKDGILQSTAPENLIPELDEIEDEARDCLTWLSENIVPRNDVFDKWNLSFPARQEMLVHPEITTEQYFTSLPCLISNLGPELLRLDFDVLFPEHDDFMRNWDNATPSLIQSMQNCKAIPAGDRGYLQGIGGMLKHNKDAVIIYLLAYLIDPPAPKRKLNERKLTSQERQESFFIHVQRENEIAPTLVRLRARSQATATRLPPVPVFVGDLVNLDKIYVSMNDSPNEETGLPTMYRVDSVLSAIDLCFKSTFALQCDFQYRASQCWVFIQRSFYNITRPKDRLNQSVKIQIGLCPNFNQEPQQPQE